MKQEAKTHPEPGARCASCRRLHAACGFLAFWPQTDLLELPEALEGRPSFDSLFPSFHISVLEERQILGSKLQQKGNKGYKDKSRNSK